MLRWHRLLAVSAGGASIAALIYILHHRRVRRRSQRASGLIFTGTGCSSGLPLVPCTLKAPHPTCTSCGPALRGGPSNPNWRGNVGALIRFTDASGTLRHVQIDCGKTYREVATLRVYREHGVQHLDALVLTHDHADAVGGLDELRAMQPFDPVTYEVKESIRVLCDRRTLTRLRHSTLARLWNRRRRRKAVC